MSVNTSNKCTFTFNTAFTSEEKNQITPNSVIIYLKNPIDPVLTYFFKNDSGVYFLKDAKNPIHKIIGKSVYPARRKLLEASIMTNSVLTRIEKELSMTYMMTQPLSEEHFMNDSFLKHTIENYVQDEIEAIDRFGMVSINQTKTATDSLDFTTHLRPIEYEYYLRLLGKSKNNDKISCLVYNFQSEIKAELKTIRVKENYLRMSNRLGYLHEALNDPTKNLLEIFKPFHVTINNNRPWNLSCDLTYPELQDKYQF